MIHYLLLFRIDNISNNWGGGTGKVVQFNIVSVGKINTQKIINYQHYK